MTDDGFVFTFLPRSVDENVMRFRSGTSVFKLLWCMHFWRGNTVFKFLRCSDDFHGEFFVPDCAVLCDCAPENTRNLR